MAYLLSEIADVFGINEIADGGQEIAHLLLDSRKVYSPSNSLFFALKGPRRDGHQFIPDLYKKGVRAFVVDAAPDANAYPGATFFTVPDTLAALQQLATWHRKHFFIPVIGITGSNGKTIIKEWLYQCLHEEQIIVRSPKSYNSQIGVPLSIWEMEPRHTLGIFEAGISQPGEMDSLREMIKPIIGILTNIGEAHNEGFSGKAQKLTEKLKLFTGVDLLIGRETDLGQYKKELIDAGESRVVLTWGTATTNDLIVKHIEKEEEQTRITVCPGSADIEFTIPFTDDASIENAITTFFTLLQLEVSLPDIIKRISGLQAVNMRLELKKGINHCSIINDSYSADIHSLEIALNFLTQQNSHARKTVIISDFMESAEKDDQLYNYIVEDLRKHRVSRLIGIGEHISKALQGLVSPADPSLKVELFPSTDIFLQQFLSSHFREEVILVKGARVFGFERIVQQLEQKVHQTVLEINLNAIVHNVNVYQQSLKPDTKIMAMVKAFAYGSGGAEIAGILQYHKVDYLGVAYADEGVELRKAGVLLPIMVMNPESSAFESIVENKLEPDLYSFEVLTGFEKFLENEGLQRYPVHLEVETGMNRLGFGKEDIEKLATRIQQSNLLRVQSVFSHLAASDDPAEDNFTLAQFDRFNQAVDILRSKLDYKFLRHISNTAAIFRLPQLQLDMVRLGIGMYGVDSSGQQQSSLIPAAALKTTIAQLKYLKPGDSVSYNRKGVITRDAVIATVRIGYADGYSRRLGHGNGKVFIRGKLAPVIGTVNMDMTMVDVTDIEGVEEGDEVILFGKELPVQDLAAWAGTIPYEIMTGISQRVKRVYFEE